MECVAYSTVGGRDKWSFQLRAPAAAPDCNVLPLGCLHVRLHSSMGHRVDTTAGLEFCISMYFGGQQARSPLRTTLRPVLAHLRYAILACHAAGGHHLHKINHGPHGAHARSTCVQCAIDQLDVWSVPGPCTANIGCSRQTASRRLVQPGQRASITMPNSQVVPSTQRCAL